MDEFQISWAGDDLINIRDGEGNLHPFELALVLPVVGQDYAVLFPKEDTKDQDNDLAEDGFLILKIVTDEDGLEELVEIEDDEEFDLVVDAWEKIVEEEG